MYRLANVASGLQKLKKISNIGLHNATSPPKKRLDERKRSINMIDAKKETENIITWIREWFEENGPRASAVIGISGGKDSSVCAALLVRALGTDRVVPVLMPDGEQSDISDSYMLTEHLGLTPVVINIAQATSAVKDELKSKLADSPYLAGSSATDLPADTIINIPPRVRMTFLYAIAQSLPNGGRVANTCNRSEDYIGYSTKYGDAAGDFSILADFTVTEVLKIGEELGLPDALVHKTPSDGLSGMSDEDKVGFTYAELDKYILEGICADEVLRARIDRMHRLNLHKLKTIPSYTRRR